MTIHSTIIACRDTKEAQIFREILSEPAIPSFTRSAPFMEQFISAPHSQVLMTPLLLDENALGLLTKLAIIQPAYSILAACQAGRSLNILQLLACGCAAIVGPNELDALPELLSPDPAVIKDIVMPHFFIDDASCLKPPVRNLSCPLHISFVGSQALMSCANALLNIYPCNMMSMACIAPSSPWTLDRLVQGMPEYTLWRPQTNNRIAGRHVTLCPDFNTLSSLEPLSQHFVVCHGHLSSSEMAWVNRISPNARIFKAERDGYIELSASFVSVIRPEKLWDFFVSALYGE